VGDKVVKREGPPGAGSGQGGWVKMAGQISASRYVL
jgi:hypothetical protein